jgi:ABC-type glycerol-3-phosphate transport system substrate-binding protein
VTVGAQQIDKENKVMKNNVKRKKVIGFLAGASLLLGTLSPSASSANELGLPSTPPTATLKVLSFMAADSAKPFVDAFQKDFPTIKIEFQSVPFNDLQPTIDARIGNKQSDLDVYWADQPRASALAARGTALDLTKVFTKFKSKFEPQAWASGIYLKKLYALPIENSTQILYYNKDLLDKAKVAYPSANIKDRLTWEELIPDVKKTVAAGAKNGLLFGQFDRYYQLQALPVSAGGGIGAQGKFNLIPQVANSGWKKAFTWYQSLFKNGLSPKGMKPEETTNAFLNGQAAYLVNGPWVLNDFSKSKLNWGVAPHPYFEGGTPVTGTGSWSLAISPFSPNKEAAAIFLKWMAVDSNYIKYRADASLAATPVGKEIYFAKPLFNSAVGKQAIAIIDYETANTAVNRVQTVGYIEFETIMNAAFSDIRNGANVGKTLRDAANKLRRAWAPYNRR